MKIEIGKLYRTRNGLKVRVDDYAPSGSPYTYTATIYTPKKKMYVYLNVTGTNPRYPQHHGEFDIIGPWEEPVTTLKVGQTYRTRSGYLAEVLHTSFKGPNTALPILVLVHHSQHDIVYGYTAQGTKPNQPQLDLVKLVTADNPVKGMSLRNLQQALHLMKKSQSDKLNHEFKDYCPGIITKDQVKAELETRCSLSYLPLKKVTKDRICYALDTLQENWHMSFLSDNTVERTEAASWRAYNRSQLQDELERRLEA